MESKQKRETARVLVLPWLLSEGSGLETERPERPVAFQTALISYSAEFLIHYQKTGAKNWSSNVPETFVPSRKLLIASLFQFEIQFSVHDWFDKSEDDVWFWVGRALLAETVPFWGMIIQG